MGLFGNLGKAFQGYNLQDRLPIAGALASGDYGGAAQIMGAQGRQRQEQEAMAAQQQQQQAAMQALIARGVPEAEAAVIAQGGGADSMLAGYNAPEKPEADDVFVRTMKGAGIDPTSPEGQKLLRDRAYTMALPSPTPLVDPETGAVRWVTPPVPGSPSPAAGAPSLPTVSDTASYEALPPGAEYLDPQGQRRKKGGAAPTGQNTFLGAFSSFRP